MAHISNPKTIKDFFDNVNFQFVELDYHLNSRKDIESALIKAKIMSSELITLIAFLENETP